MTTNTCLLMHQVDSLPSNSTQPAVRLMNYIAWRFFFIPIMTDAFNCLLNIEELPLSVAKFT